MTTWEVVWEVGRLVYSVGLLVLGGLVLRALPGMRNALRDFAGALAAHAEALRANAADEGKLDKIAAEVAELRRLRIGDRELLDRAVSVLEGAVATARSGARMRGVKP